MMDAATQFAAFSVMISPEAATSGSRTSCHKRATGAYLVVNRNGHAPFANQGVVYKMSDFDFPSLDLKTWRPTYESLRHYARALSWIRRELTPRQKHWYHASLRVNAAGLTTMPIRCRNLTFELALDLTQHAVVLTLSSGASARWRLHGQPLSQFWEELHRALGAWNIPLDVPQPDEPDAPPVYDPPAVERYWSALSQVDVLLKQFQSQVRQEASPVQFWSHHFDLAMLWFSGRLVPGQDPADEENADEQMNFGFSVGDAELGEAYFYVTAYPLPDGWIGSPLPRGAEWHTASFKGALLRYKTVAAADAPDALLLDFWRTVQRRGAELMLK